jgi:hypothetical protein
MNMIAELMGGLVPNKEKITHDFIQETLENVAEELGCSYKELFIKITSINEDFSPVFHIFHTEPYTDLNTIPRFRFVREITLKEILNIDGIG